MVFYISDFVQARITEKQIETYFGEREPGISRSDELMWQANAFF